MVGGRERVGGRGRGKVRVEKEQERDKWTMA